jgi:ribonuclease D
VNVTIEKGHTRTNWLARPLPHELLTYAREDVANLTAVYRKLASDLTQIGRLEWAKELSAAWTRPERFTPNTVDMAAKMGRRKRMDAKALSLFARLMAWREGVAQKLNVPRRRVADDQALMDISVARPDTPGHLHTFRGLHRGVMANHTHELIALCKDTSVLPELTALRAEKARDSLDERLAIELFQYAVKILAIRHKLSAKHLLDRETAERVVFGKFSSSQDWVAAELMNEEVHRMIGAELWNFLHGATALTMKNGDCIITSIPKPT